MCGRFTLTSYHEQLYQRFSVQDDLEIQETRLTWRPRFNIAPTQAVVTVTATGERRLELMRWGLVPSWAKDASIGSRLINARAETLAEKPAFRGALKKRRCLIPADGFYEWPVVAGKKQPVRIARGDGEPFAFAGLWEVWTAPDGQPVRTCTIVTTTPNALMGSLHHRMPVILEPEQEAAWLDPAATDEHLALLTPREWPEMVVYPVSPAVGNVANETPQLVLPLDELEELDEPALSRAS